MSKLLGPPSELVDATFSVRAPKGDYSKCTIVRTDAGIPMRYTRGAHYLAKVYGAEVVWLSKMTENPRYEVWYRDDKGNEFPIGTIKGADTTVEIWQ